MPPFVLYTYTTVDGGMRRYAYAAPDEATARVKGEQLARIAKQSGQPPVGFLVLPLQPTLPE
jgi:hypothetical protein